MMRLRLDTALARSVFALMLGGLGLTACTSSMEGEPRPVSSEEMAEIKPAELDDIDHLAQRIEELVLQGDPKRFEALWIKPKDLEGCEDSRGRMDIKALQDAGERNLRRFLDRAKSKLDTTRGGRVLVTNRRVKSEPLFIGRKLSGPKCKIEKWARINPAMRPTAEQRPPDVLEHRFNAVMVKSQGWRLYEYMPTPNVDCSKSPERWGCKQLAANPDPIGAGEQAAPP